MKKYSCPVCRTPLSKQKYERALGIVQAQQAHIQHLKRTLKSQKAAAANQAKLAERRRVERLMAGQRQTIKRLEERIRQLEQGTTPQSEGLAYETTLTKALRNAFPEDVIQHAGKGGDVLHEVQYGRQSTGLIVYECKRERRLSASHVEQTYRAKVTRSAEFGVLVTTGKNRKFDGLANIGGVIVVAPNSVLPLADLLRAKLIELAKAKIAKTKRMAIAQRVTRYITSPQFKNPIQDVAVRTEQLQDAIKEEAKQHVRQWEQRWVHYQRIHWDSCFIQESLELLLHGKSIKSVAPPRPIPLALPTPKSQR